MLERRSLTTPITLGVVMIVLVVVLAAVWIVGNVMGASQQESPGWYWGMLATGTVLLAGVLAGVIAYLTITVRTVNLNRRQSNFIDAVTHELKSPIASLKLYLQTMARRAVDERQQQHFHRIMLEDVERLDSLINHLLDAARIARDAGPAEEQPVRLDELLRHCGQATCLRYKMPPQSVVIDVPPLTLRSQPVQLEILFRNLIDNGLKYGGSPAEVSVRLMRIRDSRATISISDNGPGIPANQRRKVFGRFVRLGSELERSQSGTGLGLFLVRNVTHSLGGQIRVRDREDGPGTVFEVTVPGVVP